MIIDIYGHLIDHTLIRGISPLILKSKASLECIEVKYLYFEIYLIHYSIEVSTDGVPVYEQEKLKQRYDDIKKAYGVLRDAIAMNNYNVYGTHQNYLPENKNVE